MISPRVIPVLLLKNEEVFKGVKFKNHKYVGDPINTVKIFNDKEVDELIILDIEISKFDKKINFEYIESIVSEAFMPIAYGGGIRTINDIEKLFRIGIEKIVLNTSAFLNPNLISRAAQLAGSQSIVISIDVKKSIFGKYEVYIMNGEKKIDIDPVTYAKKMQNMGAGELIVTSIDREGTDKGYDHNLLNIISNAVDIPVIGHGGAGKIQDLSNAKKKTSVSALAASNLFIYHGKHKAVLISYPKYSEIIKLFE